MSQRPSPKRGAGEVGSASTVAAESLSASRVAPFASSSCDLGPREGRGLEAELSRKGVRPEGGGGGGAGEGVERAEVARGVESRRGFSGSP